MGLFFQVWVGQNLISEKTLLFGVWVQNPKPEGTSLFQAKAYFFRAKVTFSVSNVVGGWVGSTTSSPYLISHILFILALEKCSQVIMEALEFLFCSSLSVVSQSDLHVVHHDLCRECNTLR